MATAVTHPQLERTTIETVSLLGVPVANVTPDEAIECIRGFLQEDSLHHIIVVNTNKFWIASHVSGMNEILRSAAMVIPEYGPVWAARTLGTPLKANVRGVGLFMSLLPKFAQWGVPVYFLGAREEILRMMMEQVHRDYPRLRVAGAHNGFYQPDDEERILADINASGAAVLFVAMGSPRQEFFVEKYRNCLRPRIAMGVGGSFDVLAGLKHDAPAWTHNGIEWLYRLALDPKNLFWRYVRVHPWFVWQTMRQRIRNSFAPWNR